MNTTVEMCIFIFGDKEEYVNHIYFIYCEFRKWSSLAHIDLGDF